MKKALQKLAMSLAAFREADSLLVRCVLLCNYFAPIGALLGAIVLILRRNTFSFPLVSFAAVFPLLYYVTHTSLRDRHPLDAIIMLLSAAGVVELGRWLILRREALRGEPNLPLRPSTNENSCRVVPGGLARQTMPTAFRRSGFLASGRRR